MLVVVFSIGLSVRTSIRMCVNVSISVSTSIRMCLSIRGVCGKQTTCVC